MKGAEPLRYKLGLRHRATLEESVGERHATFIENLRNLAPPWGIPAGYVAKEASVPRGKLSARITLKGALGSPLKGFVAYILRKDNYLGPDEAFYDDVFFVEFNPSKVDYGSFVRSVFRRYVEAFDAYRATVMELNTGGEDWAEVVQRFRTTGKNTDGRDGVYRISAVNYYDALLCRRAFGLTPRQIVARLKGAVEQVEELGDGVLLIVDSNVLSKAELLKIDGRVRPMLS